MKDSHLYSRLSNPQAVKVYLSMIKSNDIDTVKALFGNITLEANDHPRYPAIKEAYDARIYHENNKE